MSKEIDLHLKKQLLDTPRYLKKYLKDNEEHSPGITYYTGNWGQDLQDNLTDRQAENHRQIQTWFVRGLCELKLSDAWKLTERQRRTERNLKSL